MGLKKQIYEAGSGNEGESDKLAGDPSDKLARLGKEALACRRRLKIPAYIQFLNQCCFSKKKSLHPYRNFMRFPPI